MTRQEGKTTWHRSCCAVPGKEQHTKGRVTVARVIDYSAMLDWAAAANFAAPTHALPHGRYAEAGMAQIKASAMTRHERLNAAAKRKTQLLDDETDDFFKGLTIPEDETFTDGKYDHMEDELWQWNDGDEGFFPTAPAAAKSSAGGAFGNGQQQSPMLRRIKT